VTATGIGSMPGADIDEAVRIVTGELPDLVHLPELPARGPTAGIIGRGAAVLAGLAADLQPAGWRLQDSPGIDHRRAVSLLAQDLDVFEEHTQGYAGRLKIQVVGPWTLAAAMERPRGDRALADHGARRELAQSLTEGVAEHVRDVRSRAPGAQVLLQVDEPGLPAVLGGGVPTASGFSRHRSVGAPEAQAVLAQLAAAVTGAGAVPVAHVCAGAVPVQLLRDAGFRALSFDLAVVTAGEEWAAAFDAGVDLWPGVAPSVDPPVRPTVSQLVDVGHRFFAQLGFDAGDVAERVVVTPACGLAGASPAWAREALRLTREAGGHWLR